MLLQVAIFFIQISFFIVMIEIFGVRAVVRVTVVFGVGVGVMGVFGEILSEILAGLTALFVTESFSIVP